MTKIEWTEKTWNPIVGCSIVSPGCTNCYAMKMAARLEAMATADVARQDARAHGDRPFEAGSPAPVTLAHYLGTTKPSKAGPVWTGKVALAPDHILTEPLRRRKPTMYFVNSMGDLFHEYVPDAWIDRVFAVMALTPQHTYQVLTKRSARMRAWFDRAARRDETGEAAEDVRVAMTTLVATPSRRELAPALKAIPLGQYCKRVVWPLPNCWLGISADRQQEADTRIPDLLATPAAVRFVSAEPLLGPIDFTATDYHDVTGYSHRGFLRHKTEPDDYRFHSPKLDWVIVGGESGPDARPMHPDWARSIRDQCQQAGTAFFFKQWGEWHPTVFDAGYGDIGLTPAAQAQPDAKPSKTSMVDGEEMERIGKKAAGRLLDGREWNDMPGAKSTSEDAA